MEPFRIGIGVDGMGFVAMELSESGGDGGVATARRESVFECGGVDAVGDDRVVGAVEVSDKGERGRVESTERSSEVLRW